MKIPKIISNDRKMACGNCNCGIDFEDPCAECPKGKWKKTLCVSPEVLIPSLNNPPLLEEKYKNNNHHTPPDVSTMAKSLIDSMKNWMSSGLQVADQGTIETRLNQCRSCEFWNPTALKNTGRCMKCGCSTWAKLRMATEKCPIGKW